MREKGRVVVKENDGKCVQEMLYARDTGVRSAEKMYCLCDSGEM